MKISTRARYGLKAVVDLATQYGGDPVAVSALAQMQGISEAYLEQLVAALKRAKLLTGVRGAQGGYMLSRAPEEITVGEVLRALEGTTAIYECVGDESFGCENAGTCSARPLWLKLQSKIDGVLNDTTIKDMADDYTIQKRRSE
ncbi:MAG: Rrf2 family transcriptional regulator [Bacillota bacterium]